MESVNNGAMLLSGDVSFVNIAVMSGVRPRGRIVDHSEFGRVRSGILYVSGGSVSYSKKGSRGCVVKSGDIVIIPRGAKYILRYEDDGTEFCLVDFDISCPTNEDFMLVDDITHISNMSRLSELFGRLSAISRDESDFAFFKRKELFYRLVSELICAEDIRAETVRGKYASIIPGLNLLKTRYLENIPVSRLASESHLSVSTFRRIFTEYCGLSPVQYRNFLRVRRAMALLSDSHLSACEVAEAAGFENEGYFFRYFKKITGETPSQYRSGKMIYNK